MRRLARSSPTALVVDGQVLDAQLRTTRITESELRQAVRSEGVGGFDLVAAVVLESDGTLSVIRHDRVGSGDALDDIDNIDHVRDPDSSASTSLRR